MPKLFRSLMSLPAKRKSFFAVASAVKLAVATKARASSIPNDSRDFKRWASEFDISPETLAILGELYYDSFSTLSTLTPEVTQTLDVDETQCENLNRAVASLNEDVLESRDNDNNDAESPSTTDPNEEKIPVTTTADRTLSTFKDIATILRDLKLIDDQTYTQVENGNSVEKLRSAMQYAITQMDRHGGSMESVTANEAQSKIADVENNHSSNGPSCTKTLGLTGLMSSTNSNIENMASADMHVVDIENTEAAKVVKPLPIKHVRWKKALAEIQENRQMNIARNKQVNHQNDAIVMKTLNQLDNSENSNNNNSNNTNSNMSIKTITNVINASRAFKNLRQNKAKTKNESTRSEGVDNLYFCYDDGSTTMCSAIAHFGDKGKETGQLRDVTSVLVTSDIADCVLLTCDTGNHRLQAFRPNGTPSIAVKLHEFYEPWNVVSVSAGVFAVSFKRPGCVLIISPDGKIHRKFTLTCPHGLDMANEYLYVTDICTNDVYKYNLNDNNDAPVFSLQQMNTGIRFNEPKYVAVSPLGKIFVSDTGNHSIKIFNESGEFLSQFGSYGKEVSQFKFPHGVCCDRFGHVIVADLYNNRVTLFGTEGEYIRHLVTEVDGVKRPKGVSVTNDKLYVSNGTLWATEVIVFELSAPDLSF